MFAMFRTQLGNLDLAQDRYMNGTTTPIYLKFAKDNGFTPASITLPSEAQAHWFGSSSAKKVIVYFHGKSDHNTQLLHANSPQAAATLCLAAPAICSGSTTSKPPSAPTSPPSS
jgi:hypothetical protein